MDKIIPSTFLPGINISSGDKGIVVQPQDIQINLKAGTFILIETIANSQLEGNSLITLNIKTSDGQYPLQVKATNSLPINVAEGEVQQYSAKVLKDGNLQLFPLKNSTVDIGSDQPSPVIHSTITTNIVNKVNEIVVQPLRLASMVENIMNEMNFSVSLKQQIISSLPVAEINVAIKGINENLLPDTILQPIKSILAKMPAVAEQPQQINVLQQQLEQEISFLVGKNFSAKIISQHNPTSTIILDSPIGKILGETPLRLSPHTPLQMEVSEIRVPQTAQEVPVLRYAIEELAKLIPAEHIDKIDTGAILEAAKKYQ